MKDFIEKVTATIRLFVEGLAFIDRVALVLLIIMGIVAIPYAIL
jgi:hypothetical protein